MDGLQAISRDTDSNDEKDNSWFSYDVTAALLVSQPNPPGIELYYYGNVVFCFR